MFLYRSRTHLPCGEIFDVVMTRRINEFWPIFGAFPHKVYITYSLCVDALVIAMGAETRLEWRRPLAGLKPARKTIIIPACRKNPAWQSHLRQAEKEVVE